MPENVYLQRAGGERARAALVAASVVSVALPILPFGGIIGYPLLLLSTLAHEMGHGLTALLVGLDFDSFRLFADGSGVALIGGQAGRLSLAATAAGGLTGPAVVGALLFWLSARPRLAQRALMISGVLLVIACVLVVRNVFGFVFIGAVGGSLLFVGFRFGVGIAQFTAALLAVQMALSVFSRADYLFTRTAMTSAGPMPSDVEQIADLLFLPYWFWGLVCGAISVGVLVVGLAAFWKNSKTSSQDSGPLTSVI
jgi:hypothetical protein